jgi:SAM-dependent methyltransferase
MMNCKKLNSVIVNCPLCNSENYETVIEAAEDILTHKWGKWDIVKCNQCDFVFLNPRPSKEVLYSLYTNDEEPLPYHNLSHNKQLDKGIKFWKRFKNISKREALKSHFGYYPNERKSFLFKILALFFINRLYIELIPFYRENLRVLEIGAGNGSRIRLLKELGIKDITAIELNKQMAEHILNTYGVKTHCCDLIELEFGNKFDVIIASMVLEHLDQPKKYVNKIYDLLEKGGYFIFSIPNFSGMEFRIFKEFCYALQPPFHLSHFTQRTILKLLGKFSEIKIYYQYFDRDIVASAGYRYEFLHKTIDGLVGYNPLVRKIIVKPLVRLLAFLRKTSRISVYAKK